MPDATAIAIVGITATAAVGIVGPLLTNRAAGKRLDRQLAHERKRLREQLDQDRQQLQAQLDHDRVQLRTQLAHERQLRDVAELREFLDAGAVAMRVAMWASSAIVEFLRAYPRYVSAPRKRRRLHAEVERLRTEAERAAKDAALVAGRIALLVGRDHHAYRRYDEAIDAYTDTLRDALPLFRRAVWRWTILRPEQQRALDAIFESGEDTFGERRRAYIAAAETVVGARLPSEGA